MFASVVEIVGIIALIVFCFLGVLMTAVRLPGTWVIFGSTLLYAWLSGRSEVGWKVIAASGGIALAGEVTELLMSAVMARRAGASRYGQWGGIIGGFLGMIFLSFLLPVPVVGSMIGALAGCCLGAATGEILQQKQLDHAARVGLFSAIGFALGTSAKTILAMLMSAIAIISAVGW